jgi:integrase
VIHRTSVYPETDFPAAGCPIAAGITERRLFRAVDKAGRVTGEMLSAQAVYLVVAERARKIGLELAPHDARRTFAKLAHKGKAPIEQIQIALGHESIQTTERYLGVRQDLTDAPCDHLGIELEEE